MFRTPRALSSALIAILFAAIPAYSADDALNLTSERVTAIVREESRANDIEQAKKSQKDLEAVESEYEARDVFYQFGGWLTTSYRRYEDIDNQDGRADFLRWSLNEDLYLWYYFSYRSTHNVYLQIRNSYVDRGVGESYTGIGSDYEGPKLSMAYTQINLAPEFDHPLKVTAGRQYLFLGRGVVYSHVHDGLSVETYWRDLYIKGFLSHTKPHEDNIDFSRPGFDKEGARGFAGIEAAYLRFTDTTVYGYFLAQEDLSSEHPEDALQEYDYDSYYFGAGLTHRFREQWDIYGEWIGQLGHGYTDAARTALAETDIEAWAALTGIKWRSDLPAHPIFEATYAFGSGDRDRSRVTNTAGGDTNGTDHNFLYFGYYLSGYAFQPRLSNIHIAHAGLSARPLEKFEQFKNLAVGMKYFYYRKARAEAGTSDYESTLNDADLGDELNFFLHWKPHEKVLFSTQFGVFYPGEAFPEETRDNTKYFLSSVTVNF